MEVRVDWSSGTRRRRISQPHHRFTRTHHQISSSHHRISSSHRQISRREGRGGAAEREVMREGMEGGYSAVGCGRERIRVQAVGEG
jgi:hypothetical protein